MSLTARSLIVLVALCVYSDFAAGGTFGFSAPENPAHPGMCYHPSLKQEVAVGASITDHTDCTKLSCFKSNDKPPKFELGGVTCSHAYQLPANCKEVAGDPSTDYPECCPQVKCDGPPQGSIRGVG